MSGKMPPWKLREQQERQRDTASALNASSDTATPEHMGDVSLSLFVHRPVADYEPRELCPQCEQANLINCGPRLFYCLTCGTATIFTRGPAQLEAVAAHALVTAARSVLAERAYWIEQVDAMALRIAELEAEVRSAWRPLVEQATRSQDEGDVRHDHS